jgi:hypothetical protein
LEYLKEMGTTGGFCIGGRILKLIEYAVEGLAGNS